MLTWRERWRYHKGSYSSLWCFIHWIILTGVYYTLTFENKLIIPFLFFRITDYCYNLVTLTFCWLIFQMVTNHQRVILSEGRMTKRIQSVSQKHSYFCPPYQDIANEMRYSNLHMLPWLYRCRYEFSFWKIASSRSHVTLLWFLRTLTSAKQTNQNWLYYVLHEFQSMFRGGKLKWTSFPVHFPFNKIFFEKLSHELFNGTFTAFCCCWLFLVLSVCEWHDMCVHKSWKQMEVD